MSTINKKYREKYKLAGLCTNCGARKPEAGRSNCRRCLDYQKKYRRANLAAGLCGRCKKPNDTQGSLCGECLQWAKSRTQDRKSKGLCLQCGKRPKLSGKSLCEPCRVAQRPKDKAKAAALRDRILAHYGNKCACCGETTAEFLQVDHINNDGAEHRRTLGIKLGKCRGAGAHTYRWLVKNNFPPGFQLLCANCNCAKGFYGCCPHQQPGHPACRIPPSFNT
jgi:hypothetical protein